MAQAKEELMKEIRDLTCGGAHIAVATDDLEKSVKFYTEVLGFKVDSETVCYGTRLVFVTMKDMKVELVAWDDRSDVKCGFSFNDWNHQNGILMHICLLADTDRAGLEKMVANFRQLGVKILEDVRWNPTVTGIHSLGSYCFFIEGPNGEQIEYNT